MEEQQLYAKTSKCSFGVQEVEYLGHILSHEGVKVDPNKIKSMTEWPIPKTLKNIRGFLGLGWYYHEVVKNYDQITTTLIELLKKEAFLGLNKKLNILRNLRRLCVQLLS